MNPIISALHLFGGSATYGHWQRCKSRCLAIALSVGTPGLLGAPVLVGAGDAHEAFFYEPGSGRRVTHYTLDLPINRDQTQNFVIPDDCDSAMQAIHEGAARWGSIVDRRLWKKLEGDCLHNQILHRLPQRVIEDHVSGYDFMNARLSDLPIDPRCTSPNRAGCNPLATDSFGMLLYFPLTQQVTAPPAGVECTQCEFKDGLLRGRIFNDEGGISCEAIPYGPSLRLIAVDFADINGDGFLDAVLRFVPVGPRASRAPLTLPLTRLDDSSPFTVPETTLPPPPGGL